MTIATLIEELSKLQSIYGDDALIAVDEYNDGHGGLFYVMTSMCEDKDGNPVVHIESTGREIKRR